MKTIFKVKAYTTVGKGTTTVENGLTIYTPGKSEWLTIRTGTNYEELEEWLSNYIRSHGYCYSDFKIIR